MGIVSQSTVRRLPLKKFSLWEKLRIKRSPVYFDLELTARCNNNCRHCYINVPAGDPVFRAKELSLEEIKAITDEAVALGAVWCLLTGGEPLLREDFCEIYLHLKKKGLLVSVFTNGTLVSSEHVRLFKRYPPRDVEITVYGISESTYERVTRKPGSFASFIRGLNLLRDNGIKVRMKAMALRSNIHEFAEIVCFCKGRTKDYFRFDPFIQLRADGDQSRNEEIKSERLSAAEIVALEQSDDERFPALMKSCTELIRSESPPENCRHLFHCGAGVGSFTLGLDGVFRLCPSLFNPQCVFDLRKGSLSEAWHKFVPAVLNMRSNRIDFMNQCRVCPWINFCMWCPALSYLETGEMDTPVEYFCEVAHARVKALVWR